MKITKKVLRLLGAKLLDKEKNVWELNCYYKLHWTRHCNLGELGSYDVWEMRGYHEERPGYGHVVTDVEEFATFAYKDGYDDGRNSLRQDLKELLNHKD